MLGRQNRLFTRVDESVVPTHRGYKPAGSGAIGTELDRRRATAGGRSCSARLEPGPGSPPAW